jgi:hypothetical protein
MKKNVLLIIFLLYLSLNFKEILGEGLRSQTISDTVASINPEFVKNKTLSNMNLSSVTNIDCLNSFDYTYCNLPIEIKAVEKKNPAQMYFQSSGLKVKAAPKLSVTKKQPETKTFKKLVKHTGLFKNFESVQAEAKDPRAETLEKFLKKHNSPLVPYSKDFVYWADYYEIDWRLVPAITGVESTFGKRIPKNSYNAYGWNNGDYKFSSWPASIEHVSKTLREKYINKNADSIDKIARRYAPPSKTWAGNVKFFMNKIDDAPIN